MDVAFIPDPDRGLTHIDVLNIDTVMLLFANLETQDRRNVRLTCSAFRIAADCHVTDMVVSLPSEVTITSAAAGRMLARCLKLRSVDFRRWRPCPDMSFLGSLHGSVTTLNLSRTRVEAKDLGVIAVRCPFLTTLTLHDCRRLVGADRPKARGVTAKAFEPWSEGLLRGLINLTVRCFDMRSLAPLAACTGLETLVVMLRGTELPDHDPFGPLAALVNLSSLTCSLPRLNHVHSLGVAVRQMTRLHSLDVDTGGGKVWQEAGGLGAIAVPSLTLLNLRLGGLPSLSGIEGCHNLKQLRVRCGPDCLTDLSALAGCTALTHLDMQVKNGATVDLAPLRACIDMCHLTIDSQARYDLVHLSHLPSLTYLSMEGRRSRDLTPLSGCHALTQLHVPYYHNTTLHGVLALAGCVNLRAFNAPGGLPDVAKLVALFAARGHSLIVSHGHV